MIVVGICVLAVAPPSDGVQLVLKQQLCLERVDLVVQAASGGIVHSMSCWVSMFGYWEGPMKRGIMEHVVRGCRFRL